MQSKDVYSTRVESIEGLPRADELGVHFPGWTEEHVI